jgi:hypothetical protein
MEDLDGEEIFAGEHLRMAQAVERLRRLCSAFAGPQAEQARDA